MLAGGEDGQEGVVAVEGDIATGKGSIREVGDWEAGRGGRGRKRERGQRGGGKKRQD